MSTTGRDDHPIVHGPSKIGFRWTHATVAYALDRFHRRNLRTPTLRELRAGVEELPSHATIRRMYGNAGNMFRSHGYRVRSAGGQLGRKCNLRRDARGLFLPEALSVEAEPADHGPGAES